MTETFDSLPNRVVPVKREQSPDRRKAPLRERLAPYLILLPASIAVGVVLIPFINAVWWTLTNYRFNRPVTEFIWFRNYWELFTVDWDIFLNSTLVTFTYAISAVAIQTLLGTFLAFLLNQRTLVGRILQPFLLMPLMIAPLISTLIWRLMMSPDFGVLNYFLSLMNPEWRYFGWASARDSAMMTVVLVDVWTFTPFIALLVLAGLRSLPKDPFEASRVDGASGWFIFRNLTLPMLTPYITIAVIFRLIDSLRQFDIIFGMSKGGPGDALMSYQVWGYTNTFTYQRAAEGLTFIMVNWIIIFLISQFMVSFWRRSQDRIASRSGVQ